ncbi:MAG: ABC transporter substrate-binding protein [Negativicutes bacterium]
MKKRDLVMVLMILIACLVLAGCSSGPSKPAPAASGTDKVLKLRLPSSLASLNPQHTTALRDMKVWTQIYEGLYGIDESKNGYYQELAKDVKLSADKKVYTITLRDGVKFQNGEPLKASDVVFTYKRAMKDPRFGYLTAKIKDVTAVNDSTVVITLSEAYAPILHTFYSLKILNEKEVASLGDKFGTVPSKAGTGPYYPTEYNVATGVKLQAFANYWGGAPSIKKIEYRVISDDSSVQVAFHNKELDYLEDVALSNWNTLKEQAGPENNAMIKGNNIHFLAVNYQSPTNNGVLASDKVRQAIFYAINKDDINKAMAAGYGTPAVSYMPHEYVPTSPETGFETYKFNLAKAKELLKEAGYPNGIDVGTIISYPSPTSFNGIIAQVIQSNLAEAGIKTGVQIAVNSIITPKMYSQNYDLAVFSDSNNFDFNNIRQQVHSESKGMYLVKYKDGKFDWQRIEKLVELGAAASDNKERLKHYTELWKIVMDTATIDPLLHRPVAIVWAKGLDIGKPVPTIYKVKAFSWKK